MVGKLVCYLIGFSLLAATIHADRLQLCNQEGNLSKRCLNGHLFPPSSVSNSPFLTTDIGSGVHVQSGHTLDTSSKPYERHAAFSGGLNYDLQIAVLEWLSVFGGFSGGLLSGSGNDIFNLGIGRQFDYFLGTRFLLWKNQRFLISSSANFIGTGYTGLNLMNFATTASNLIVPIQACFNGPSKTADDKKAKKAACASINKALTKFNYELGFNAEVVMAAGINPTMGFRTNLGYQQLFRSKTDASDFKGQVYGGIAFSIDMAPITPIPIGFLFGAEYAYQLDNRPSEFFYLGALTLHGGIFYTGSQNFSIGLEVSDEIAPVGFGPVVDRSNMFSGSLNLRYYWN